jgi:hypothetical protein
MVDEGNYSSAASLLHSLLWSKLAPKYFWVTLLMDAIPFLTADELLFTSEQTYELLQCLQVSLSGKCGSEQICITKPINYSVFRKLCISFYTQYLIHPIRSS